MIKFSVFLRIIALKPCYFNVKIIRSSQIIESDIKSMKIVVMKFGGTSVANLSKIRDVAKIVEENSQKNKIVVVLSAMSGVTNQLQSYVEEVSSEPSRETDLVRSEEHTSELQSQAYLVCRLLLEKKKKKKNL